MAECNGECAVHGMVMSQIVDVYKRTEELYLMMDKRGEETEIKIEKACVRQKELLKEVVTSANDRTRLWIIGQGFGTVVAVLGVVKLFLVN